METERYAAIDIGTNAVRLLIGRIHQAGAPKVEKELLVRVPLRLGTDVFSHRELRPHTVYQLTETLAAFSHLLEVFQPRALRACATSAMRESINGAEVARNITEKTGIDLEIIDGQEEARVLFANRLKRNAFDHDTCLYVDVGGGSTELNLYARGRRRASRSFKIGGVRILSDAVSPKEWKNLQSWLEDHCRGLEAVAIGSGGNIGRLHRMAKLDEAQPLGRKKLASLIDKLEALDVAGRISTYKLKPDRADVIVPAGKIYLAVMKWAKIDKIFVPKFGLADGLILQMHRQYEKRRSGTSLQSAISA